jgi:hypothetical protein
LLDEHLHLHRNLSQLQRSRFRAERVGLALQLLDQEVQPLADLAAGAQQPFDLVQVRAKTGQFLGHVDADSEGRGLAQRAFAQALGAEVLRRAGGRQRLVPALQEALLLTLHHRRHHRLGGGGQLSQSRQLLLQHLDQPGTLAGACLTKALDAFARGLQRGILQVRWRGGAAAPQQRFVHRQRTRLRQPALHLVFEPAEAVQLLGGGLGPGIVGVARGGHAQLDLAALEDGGDQLTQRRLERAHLVRQPEGKIQEAPVDRTQLDVHRARRPAAVLGLCGIGVSGHAVD